MSIAEFKGRLVDEVNLLKGRNPDQFIWTTYDLALQIVTDRIMGVAGIDETRGRKVNKNLLAEAKSIQRILDNEPIIK